MNTHHPKHVMQIMRLPHADAPAPLPMPAYESAHAAGLDLLACLPADSQLIIQAGGWQLVPTGLVVMFPPGVTGQVMPVAGLAAKYGVFAPPLTFGGDYGGEVNVLLANIGSEPFAVKRGARIAQLVLLETVQASILEAARPE